MPHTLEGLLVVPCGARRIADDRGVQIPVAGQHAAQIDVLLPTVGRTAAQFGDSEPETAVPLDLARQFLGSTLDGGAAEAGIEDERLDVAGR